MKRNLFPQYGIDVRQNDNMNVHEWRANLPMKAENNKGVC